MQLYYLLSSISYATIRSLFSSEIINRGKPYIKRFDIASIRYDEKKDTCNATVFGTERYRVTIARKGSNLAMKCTCPAAQDWTPNCKHAAAVLTVIVEYFSRWDIVGPREQFYYTTILDKTFSKFKQAATALDSLIPTFTKPSVIFVQMPQLSNPHIVLMNGNEKTNKLGRLIEKSHSKDFDSVLNAVFDKNELFDFFIYHKQNFVRVDLDKASPYIPIWKLKLMATEGQLSFVCKKEDSDPITSCIPLGSNYAIDLNQNVIIPLSVVDQYSYKHLHNSAYNTISVSQFPEHQYSKTPSFVGSTANLSSFIQSAHQLSLIQNVKISVQNITTYFSFSDKNLQMSQVHVMVTDGNDNPLDLPLAPYERRVVASETFHSSDWKLSAIMHISGSNILFQWPAEFAHSFFELIDRLFQENYASHLPAMLEFAQSFQDPHITDETRKQLLFNHAGTSKISDDFFKKMHTFWTTVDQYNSYKILYNIEKEQFEYFLLKKSQLFIAIMALINFAVKHTCETQPDNETTSVSINISKQLLGPLATYLQSYGIALYFNQKKVVQRKLSIEVDMQSTQDWFSISPSFYEKDVLLSEEEWQMLLASIDPFNESNTELQIFDEETKKMLEALRSIKNSYTPTTSSKNRTHFEIPRLHIFSLLSMHKSGVRLKTSPEDKKILQGLHNFTHIPAYPIPQKLQCIMRDYQVQGYNWLGFLYQHKFGACLADDMGLGKTVQTIAFLAGINEGTISSWDQEHNRSHLIIAPASVIGNWESEIKKFYPDFIVQLYLGAQRERNFNMIDIVLTTYDTIRSDLDTLKKIPFHVIVFDEAQAVKNQKSQRAEAAHQLQAIFKVSLTGTPLENNAQELCSIMNLTLPGLLPDDSVVTSLVKKGEYQALHEKIAPFVLRRTKQEYLQDLPEKTEHDVYLTMTKKQKGFYGAIVDEIKQEVYRAYREKTKAQAGIVALTALLRLRQICVAPALVDKRQDKLSPKIEYLLEEIAQYTKKQIPLLVFSQFTGMLDIVMDFLQKKKIPYLRIDGTVPAIKRKKIVEEFQKNNKIFIFLLSLKTGGVGLNLTRARVVIHLDPWWNPAVENQASDRVHRIGQQHDVKIIRLLMKDSIEEKMLILKQKKKELFEAIMQGASGARGTALTQQDFDFLLK